jgi:hypothetical protein
MTYGEYCPFRFRASSKHGFDPRPEFDNLKECRKRYQDGLAWGSLQVHIEAIPVCRINNLELNLNMLPKETR